MIGVAYCRAVAGLGPQIPPPSRPCEQRRRATCARQGAAGGGRGRRRARRGPATRCCRPTAVRGATRARRRSATCSPPPMASVLASHGEAIGVAGANVAEYRALLAGLEHARGLGLDQVEARCDARLVVDHVTGDRDPANPRCASSAARSVTWRSGSARSCSRGCPPRRTGRRTRSSRRLSLRNADRRRRDHRLRRLTPTTSAASSGAPPRLTSLPSGSRCEGNRPGQVRLGRCPGAQGRRKARVGDDDVLVRVRAAGVDQGVWHLMAGLPYLIRLAGFGLRAPKNPVLGADVAGMVEAVGKEVTRVPAWRRGVRNRRGLLRRVRLRVRGQLAPKPANLTFEQAAVVAISGLTALQGLRDQGTCARTEGADPWCVRWRGDVRRAVAKAFGAQVTGVCSTAKVDLVRSLGADHVIDYTREDFADGQQRYDVILDIGGNASLSHFRRALTPKGTLVIAGGEADGAGSGAPIASSGRWCCRRSSARSWARSSARENHEDLWSSRSSSKPARSPRSSTGPTPERRPRSHPVPQRWPRARQGRHHHVRRNCGRSGADGDGAARDLGASVVGRRLVGWWGPGLVAFDLQVGSAAHDAVAAAERDVVGAWADRASRDAAGRADAGQAGAGDPARPVLRAQVGRVPRDRVPRRRRGGDRQPQGAADDALLPRGRRGGPARASRRAR